MLVRNVRRLLLLATTAALLLGGTGRSFAAEKDPADKGAEAAAKPDAKVKGGKRKDGAGPKGRLPAYYDDVVDPEQRAKIYAIQAQHNPEIEKLNAAVKAASAKRDAEIFAVLNPTQQEKVTKLQEEAKAKRGKGKMEGKDEAKTASAEGAVKKQGDQPADTKAEK